MHSRVVHASIAVALLVVGCGPSSLQPGSADGGDGIVERADGSFGSGSGGEDGSASGGNSGSGSGSSSGGSASGGSGGGSTDGGSHGDGGGAGDGGIADGGAGTPPGQPITCPAPGTYAKNGGSCGTERWDIKTGTDSHASSLSLVPESTSIATLVALAAAGGGTTRESPTETTLWELKNVTLSMIKLESDSDYHMVLSDGSHTMIAEIPYPNCATASAWSCFISRARGEVDAKYTVGSPQYPAATVTVRGVGFFDFSHGQTGVAPNAIELHPVLQICFGADCTPT